MDELYESKGFFEDDWSFEDPISTEEINDHIYKGRAIPLLDNDDLV